MQIIQRSLMKKSGPRTPAYEQDRELAERITKGDKEALARLVDRHLVPVYRYLSRRVGPGNEKLIAEIVEAALSEGFRDLRLYATGKASLALRLRLLRLANKHLARRRRRIVVAIEQVKEDSLTELRTGMMRLSPRRQAAIALALFEEMPPEEIARVLRTTPAGAMHTLRGALRRLRKGKRYEGIG